ncbi:MAG TPA: hypothetical protein VKU77_15575 [Streptosporangiaceae bacterium]|nr:hypothetical protein [Streptosporangiaceae bacterium]
MSVHAVILPAARRPTPSLTGDGLAVGVGEPELPGVVLTGQ